MLDVRPLSVSKVAVLRLNLVIPERSDPERESVAQAWVAAGGDVTRLGRFWEPPPFDRDAVRIYGNDTFGLVLAQKLDLRLVSPSDALLTDLPQQWLGRNIIKLPLGLSSTFTFPIFVKPCVPKQFRAAVYASERELLDETSGLELETELLIANVVSFLAEGRSFLLNGTVLDFALYEGEAPLDGAFALLRQVADSPLIPHVCAVDVGLVEGCGWVVVEANAAWGAGLNGCQAGRVLPAIAAATTLGEV